MKKVVFALFVLLFTALTNSFAQTEAPAATRSVKEALIFSRGNGILLSSVRPTAMPN